MPLSDQSFMRRALALARKGGRGVRPNPQVGALIVKDGKIIAKGWHKRAGGPHAEIEALSRAGDSARGATLYVTLEPCNHRGRTGPCSEEVIRSGVGRVVVAARDPNPKVGGGGLERLRGAGIDVQTGVCAELATALNAAWLHSLASDRPFVTLLLKLSLNGVPLEDADAPQHSAAGFRRYEHALRAAADAVVSAGEIFCEGISIGSVPADGTADVWRRIFADLRSGDRQSLLCEDASLAVSLIRQGFADRICIYHAPVILAGTSASKFDLLQPGRLELLGAQRLGDGALSIYEPKKREGVAPDAQAPRG